MAPRDEETKLRERARDASLKWHRRPAWWREASYVVVFYMAYNLVRNAHGNILSVTTANAHALDVVRLERWLGIFNEYDIQQYFLQNEFFVRALNIYYGSAHFVITLGVLIWLYRVETARYRHWRNIIFCTTAVALVGYISYPLAPPRLLPSSFGFVDTMDIIGGTWSFDSGAAHKISNQYAAMPSLHVAWALWCAFAVMPTLKKAWTRALLTIYPAITISAIIITANHYWMDVFAGAATFGFGYVLGTVIENYVRRNYADLLHPESVGHDATPAITSSEQGSRAVATDPKKSKKFWLMYLVRPIHVQAPTLLGHDRE